MYIYFIFLLSTFIGILFSQLEMNYSYELKYGNGKQVKEIDGSIEDYSYFENLLDINTYYKDNIYIYTQLEYGNPPIYGYNRTIIDYVIPAFYIEYSQEYEYLDYYDRINIKIGDLYELYGRGIAFYTLQDQNIDYDNSIRGLAINYLFKDNLKISTLFGSGTIDFRSSPINRLADYQFYTNAILGSIEYETNTFGYIQFLYLNQSAFLNPDAIKKIYNSNMDIRMDLNENERIPSEMIDYMLFGSGEGYHDTLYINNYNANWNFMIGNVDIYMDKSWLQYNQIYGADVFGSRFYTSLYTELFEIGVTYEYKNYYTPYLVKTMSNPPIVYREGTSVLGSRNAHSINFGNEIGHQIDINKNLFGNINLAANLSLSHRHQVDNMRSISLVDIISMKDENTLHYYYPFRQFYLELNGWNVSEELYYKIGFDQYIEFVELSSSNIKKISANTIPTHWMWKLVNGSSFILYLEAQEKYEESRSKADFIMDAKNKYTNYYSSLSYSHKGKWIVTAFYDQEIKDGKANHWIGTDISYKLNTKTQISIFYGSQKGGLVCANGICAEQPGFEDGFKVNFSSLF
tara:strand:+ start:3783 stop:5504 length:1722 start_codon:yes stop_codon:yes gene_type:complete